MMENVGMVAVVRIWSSGKVGSSMRRRRVGSRVMAIVRDEGFDCPSHRVLPLSTVPPIARSISSPLALLFQMSSTMLLGREAGLSSDAQETKCLVSQNLVRRSGLFLKLGGRRPSDQLQ